MTGSETTPSDPPERSRRWLGHGARRRAGGARAPSPTSGSRCSSRSLRSSPACPRRCAARRARNGSPIPIWGSGSDVSRGWAYTHMLKDYVVLHPLLVRRGRACDRRRRSRRRARRRRARARPRGLSRAPLGRPLERGEGGVSGDTHLQARRADARRLPRSANELLPYALALHLRMGARFPEYADAKCRLPVWAPPFRP